MEQTLLTVVCGIVLIAVVFLSYKRHKDDENNSNTQCVDVKTSMQEMTEYFGLSTKHQGTLSRSLDLAPMEIASALTNQTQSRKNKKAKRKS